MKKLHSVAFEQALDAELTKAEHRGMVEERNEIKKAGEKALGRRNGGASGSVAVIEKFDSFIKQRH